MKARYYGGPVGRFMSPDPVGVDARTGGNFNRYWYANNNPHKYVDPDGRQGKLAWLVELSASGMRKVARLSKEQAVQARKAEKNVLADRRQVSHEIETAANGVKDQLKHSGHDLKDDSGNVVGKGLPHYQTDGKLGHAFWGKVSSFAIGAATLLDIAAEAADAIDPSTLLSSSTSDLPNHSITWFGAYEQIDPSGPDYYEALAEASAKKRIPEKETKKPPK